MDSRAYLTRQGWRGDGHSLDHTNRGISKPLLVSKKVDVLGVGLNKHAAVSDQWWLRAYDQGLKDFGTGTKSALANVQEHGVNRGGLYGRFVKGEGVPGTFGEDSAGSTGDQLGVGRGTDVPTAQAIGIMAGGKRKREGGLAKKKIARRKTEDKPVTDLHETIATERDHERTAEIDRQANEYVLEAQRLGILSSGPNDTPTATGANSIPNAAAALPGFAEIVATVQAKGVGKQSSKKTDKYAREKMKRLMKRTARAYLTGEAPGIAEKEKNLAQKALKSREDNAAGSAGPPRTAKGKQSMEKKANDEAQSRVREPRKLSTAKLAEYTKRATEKGMAVEAYIARRDEKYAVTQADKRKSSTQSEKPAQEATAIPTNPATNATPSSTALEAGRPLFVVDTAGSDSVMIDANDPDCGAKATSAISRDQKFTIVGAAGTESLTWTPGAAIPLDTRIWVGVTPKELPKIVRKARKDWMAVRREQKKQSKLGVAPDDLAKTAAVKKKARGQLKVEKREAFVRNILLQSRKAGTGEGKTATVDGIQDVPLLTVTTDHGAFTKGDVSKARTVARRVLRDEKRAEKAAKGKGKGWKKVQRAAEATEKEVARLAQSMA